MLARYATHALAQVSAIFRACNPPPPPPQKKKKNRQLYFEEKTRQKDKKRATQCATDDCAYVRHTCTYAITAVCVDILTGMCVRVCVCAGAGA